MKIPLAEKNWRCEQQWQHLLFKLEPIFFLSNVVELHINCFISYFFI